MDHLKVPEIVIASPNSPRLSRMMSLDAFQGASSLGDAFKQRSETSAQPMTRLLGTSGTATKRHWPHQLDIIIYYYKDEPHYLMIFNIECSTPYLNDLFTKLRFSKVLSDVTMFENYIRVNTLVVCLI